MSALRLDAEYIPGDGAGSMWLRLLNAGRDPLAGFHLAVTCLLELTPAPDSGCQLTDRVSGWHLLAPPTGFVLDPGAVWPVGPLWCTYPAGHANDGPESAYVVRADGTTAVVRVGAARLATARVGSEAAPPLRLATNDDWAAEAWASMARCEGAMRPHDAPVLAMEGDPVEVVVDRSLEAEAATIAATDDSVTIRAGSAAGLRHALAELVRRRCSDGREAMHVPCAPRYGWRGLQIDLARQFIPPADVAELIELAAWHRLNRVHLHLTDDEGWRLPSKHCPALTEVGAWRGDGLAIPPLLGSGPEPYGGSYSPDDIGRWVHRAAELGVELVPEIDLPGHCFAALAAVPDLRDPHDMSGARSVQFFVDNVLNPGVAATMPFLEGVLEDVADLFPGEWIHVGGDEVPHLAWSASPLAATYAAHHGIEGTAAIEAAFMREVVELVTVSMGRKAGVWQEAAGALQPGDGYAVGWKSAADCRALAAAGHQVVASPAEVYYVDIADDPGWEAPGMSWAGHTTVEHIELFDLAAGWSDSELCNLLGIQVGLWTEHVHDRATMMRLLMPRLAAIANSAWH